MLPTPWSWILVWTKPSGEWSYNTGVHQPRDSGIEVIIPYQQTFHSAATKYKSMKGWNTYIRSYAYAYLRLNERQDSSTGVISSAQYEHFAKRQKYSALKGCGIVVLWCGRCWVRLLWAFNLLCWFLFLTVIQDPGITPGQIRCKQVHYIHYRTRRGGKTL